ncbi:MAG: hypothetical protein HY360_04535 [Verrucomicrobia bacterium]|nr:hypothetical protein [Verrucomicrobiota bacterium]
MTINPKFRALIPPLTFDELQQLEANLLADGCRDPLVTWRDILLDGHNRFDICQRHKVAFKTVAMEFEDEEAAMDWIDANQLGRRNLPPHIVSVLRGRIYNRRKKAPHSRPGNTGGKRECQSDTPAIDTAEQVAAETGVSRRTIIRDGKLAAEVEADPNLQKAMNDRAEFKKVRRKKKEARRERRREANRAKVSSAPSLEKIEAKFSTILIDPPWDWGDEGDHDQLGRAKADYATLTLDELLALPVEKLSDSDCHLYLWITNRSLPKGFALLEQWGFRYITALTWPKPCYGMGNYFRGQTEHILFGVKGSQSLKRKDASTLLPIWKRGKGGHSSKPTEIYEFIESCSPGPYLEMFSRCARKDWTAWGEGK